MAASAAIRDIISVSKRRNPYISIILYPALVQGDGAAASIVNGIETLQKYGVDVIIVGRGGGSLEDLWAFNEEEVAYAIFQCDIPIISAVGHEIDVTISDFTADLRAATPSAAAELAVPDVSQIISDLDDYSKSLERDIKRVLDINKRKIELYTSKLTALSPQNKLSKQKILIDSYNKNIDLLIKNIIKRKRSEVENLSNRLKGVSPLERLKAGMAYLTDDTGKRIVGVASLNINDSVKITMKDGYAKGRIEFIEKENA